MGLAAFSLLLTAALATASQSQAPKDQVKTMLTTWHASLGISDSDLAAIKAMPKEGMPILASFLDDKDLGFLAESAMNEIDAMAATPYLLADLPNKDGNIQRDAFRAANLLIWQYDLSRISGPEKIDPTKTPPRWPVNTKPYPYLNELHKAALAVAKKDFSMSGLEVVKTIALTGSRHDIALLNQIATKDPLLAETCLAAKARLGDKQAIAAIESELKPPVHAVAMESFYRDSGSKVDPPAGAMVADHTDGQRIRTASWQAAFTLNPRFVPSLMAHVDDPVGQFHGDYSDPSPNQFAMDALSTILLGKEYSPITAQEWHAKVKAS